MASLEEARRRLTEELLGLPALVGTAIGIHEGSPCLQVMLACADEETRERVPDSYEGHVVVVEVTGEVRARN